ncbi:thiolase [Bordetella genomosp. 10]|uniref:Thiolase n=1 Tax=Bordetella genomosp. 10 TaxID=1416804 RepID=A0A261SA39_9BORD|nr:thiolase [Bordetella genomosp. 10]OZI34025.1 thiolase [Bordetella genomosp. 10]
MMHGNFAPLRGAAAITGIGCAGMGDASGYTEMEILSLAAQRAVADAGLKMADIDGLCTCSASATMWALPVAEYLGLRPAFVDSTMLGGSSFVAHLLPAVHALLAGDCTHVLVCYGSTQRSGAVDRAAVTRMRQVLDPQPYETPYQPMQPISAYALATARHMHRYGTTRRQLAEVAVAARQWARLNPDAYSRDPLTIEDVIDARKVCDPLTVRDCCLLTDGAGAFVLTLAERAKDGPRKPVYVLGNASETWHRQVSSMPDLTVTSASRSGPRALAMAGLSIGDVDLACLYDAFTINVILFLEDLGFCAKGEGGAFVQDGGIAPGGRLPVNTNGGGLSYGHPGMYGIFLILEAVAQLRGSAGARQQAGVEVALVHGNGATLSSQSTAILATEAAL